MLKYLREIRKYRPSINFADDQLPLKIPHSPTITMTREKIIRFRINYEVLLEVLGDILDIDYTKLCLLDIIKHYYNKDIGEINGKK